MDASSARADCPSRRHELFRPETERGLRRLLFLVLFAATGCGDLFAGGYAFSWGAGPYSGGACSEGGCDSYSCEAPPKQNVPGFASGVVQVAAGTRHTCALLDTGALECWGNNESGQLGDGGDSTSSNAPVDVSIAGSVAQIAAGFDTTCAILDDGVLECWGGFLDQRSPVEVEGLGGSVASVAIGEQHLCAVLDSGALQCLGSDLSGQLGDGSNAGPGQPRVANVDGLASGVVQVAAGGDHTCALLDTGAVMCWGNTWYGALGNGADDGHPQEAPVAVVGMARGAVQIAAGEDHTCALLESGALQCWGSDLADADLLGDGRFADYRSTPDDVLGLASRVVAVAAGGQHTCALLDTGALQCWGNNNSGELGNPCPRSDPDGLVDVAGLASPVVDVATGGYHTCALLDTGALACWGNDDSGQLGGG